MKSKNVDEYIESAPKEVQAKLEELRKVIQDLIPNAKESISYGMPYYDHKGRVVYFATMKNHIGLYIPPPIIENHKKELESYTTTKSAVHLEINKDLPIKLIKKLITARIKWNEKTTR
jgi:uncharacterized protein YdhG (YjbR/CyaY superfamily)